jgi:hypothetical protein
MCRPILGNMANPVLLRTGMVTLLLVLVSRKTTRYCWPTPKCRNLGVQDAFFATVPCSHKTSEFVPLPLGIYYAWLSLYAGVLSFHVSGKASTHSAAMTQNPCAPTRA